MTSKYVLGMDIGGTNTDAVIVNAEGQILASHKVSSSFPADKACRRVLDGIFARTEIRPADISRICVGSTQALNSLLTRQNLYRVGLLRLVATKPLIPPAMDWPTDAREAILAYTAHVSGGFECDGRESSSICENEIKEKISEMQNLGVESIAIVGSFSPLFPNQEKKVLEICQSLCNLPVTLSHQIASLGFIERENASLVNAALQGTIQKAFSSLKKIVGEFGLDCPLFFTQNNGTLLTLEDALEMPLKTVSSGPTNSCVGAARLCNVSNAVIIDIGGTSTDVGVVIDGFVRRSSTQANLGGIALNFAMPDVLSIAIGGGSVIRVENDKVQIGPDSVGFKSQADKVTLTDLAIELERTQMTKFSSVVLTKDICHQVLKEVQTRTQYLVDRIKGPRKDLVVIAVGGGAQLNVLENVLCPPYANVANAYGAALAQISGTVDEIVSLEKREEVLKELEAKSFAAAIENGSNPDSSRVIFKEVIPFHYIPGKLARVRIIAAGDANL